MNPRVQERRPGRENWPVSGRVLLALAYLLLIGVNLALFLALLLAPELLAGV